MRSKAPWPAPAPVVEEVLRTSTLVIRSSDGAAGGVTGASKLHLYACVDDLEFSVKWKAVPSRYDSWNNSPRKEIAAYEMQKLFLDPDDYVVPPTVLRCLPLSAFDAAGAAVRANVPDRDCVLGVLSVWLQDVRFEKSLYDPGRFANDARYARHLADLNVLTVLIGHKDGRMSNFMVSNDETDRRVFSIDNGIAFDPWIYNFFVPNWDSFRVGAADAGAIDRVRALTDEDFGRFGVVTELRLAEDGLLHTAPAGRNLDPTRGARLGSGVIQFGLTRGEISAVRARRTALLDAVDRGEIALL
jgi:hypothetical protein